MEVLFGGKWYGEKGRREGVTEVCESMLHLLQEGKYGVEELFSRID